MSVNPSATNGSKVTIYVKWKQIKLFPDYYISNTGLLRHGKTICVDLVRAWNYHYAVLHYAGIENNTRVSRRHHYDIHRLVWDYFGSEPHKKGWEINHKDGNNQNNHIDNLELITAKAHKELHAILRRNNKNAA